MKNETKDKGIKIESWEDNSISKNSIKVKVYKIDYSNQSLRLCRLSYKKKNLP